MLEVCIRPIIFECRVVTVYSVHTNVDRQHKIREQMCLATRMERRYKREIFEYDMIINLDDENIDVNTNYMVSYDVYVMIVHHPFGNLASSSFRCHISITPCRDHRTHFFCTKQGKKQTCARDKSMT